MDINQYILSGILEDYVLGQVSDQERREVECMSHIYPEVRQELEKLESSIEAYAFAHQVVPPMNVKNKIFKQIEELEKITDQVSQKSKAKIVDITASTVKERNNLNIYKLAVAASVSLFIIATFLSAFFYSTLEEQKQIVNSLIEEKYQVSENLAIIEENLNKKSEELAILNNPNNIKIVLKGIENKAPDGLTSVYWNSSNKEVHLSLSSLPEPPKGKQYQLWAIVEGKPVDMGVFNYNIGSLQKMKQVETPQAFAVTLEDFGGSPTPTLEEMYVIGNV